MRTCFKTDLFTTLKKKQHQDSDRERAPETHKWQSSSAGIKTTIHYYKVLYITPFLFGTFVSGTLSKTEPKSISRLVTLEKLQNVKKVPSLHSGTFSALYSRLFSTQTVSIPHLAPNSSWFIEYKWLVTRISDMIQNVQCISRIERLLHSLGAILNYRCKLSFEESSMLCSSMLFNARVKLP